MKRRLFRTPIVAALFAVVLIGLVGPAGAVTPTYSNGFETDTAGWFDNSGTITQRPDFYDTSGDLPYADGIDSASGGFHARLDRGTCQTQVGGGGDTVNCPGPFTRWGGYASTWYGGWTTQVDIYLDATYAQENADSYGGNIACLEASDPSLDPACKGTRFDYTSAVNNAEGNHLRDFGFNVATGPDLHGNLTCTGWIATAGTNVNRTGADAYNPAFNPQCIPDSGWYTFKHTFYADGNNLKVLMQIIPVGSATPVADWTVTSGDLIVSPSGPSESVGCNRYGWFSNQEIFGLPIDNASIDGGCTAPLVPVGKITPTGTTCQQYRDDTETTPVPVLDQLLYTVKGGKINAVSPGVFFYYTKVSGDAGQFVDITEANDATSAPEIPINQGQVVLYDASTCKVVKWTVSLGPEVGEATGTLPKDGNFIIGVKYNASALKGKVVPNPTTVRYTFGAELEDVPFDEAFMDLVPKT
jgi:hypothetical protein